MTGLPAHFELSCQWVIGVLKGDTYEYKHIDN
ncbi:Uncharacterised protein [Streptococcus suis]|nr:Uncharacterised protein [Streptococcus suis]CYU84755.1 Uncharacterised protein [Streptococcus suis]